MYTKILIAGANSYIASQCIPGLNPGNSDIFLVSRGLVNSNFVFERNQVKRLEIKDYKDVDVLKRLVDFLQLNSSDRLLIISFIGSFGSIESLSTLSLESFCLEVNENLIPFMVLSKLITICKEGLFLSFSGAGVGGDNLELASPSYLASKASLAILIEGLDSQFKGKGIRFGAISPGAFPSKMQKFVAESLSEGIVTAERREQALKTLDTDVNPSNLIRMLNFLIQNPESAGGRVWSANFDQPTNDIKIKNFGKLRRVF